MFKIAKYETFKDGQVIFEEGSTGNLIYVVKEGEVAISKKVEGQCLILDILKKDDIFGEMAYIDKEPRSTTATAKGETVIGIVDQEFFDNEFNKLSPELQKILQTVALRLRRTTVDALKTLKE